MDQHGNIFTVQRLQPGPPKVIYLLFVFNQSEADSLTKNFDFVVLKANQICS